jgi:hypothetical protein
VFLVKIAGNEFAGSEVARATCGEHCAHPAGCSVGFEGTDATCARGEFAGTGSRARGRGIGIGTLLLLLSSANSPFELSFADVPSGVLLDASAAVTRESEYTRIRLLFSILRELLAEPLRFGESLDK